MLKHLTFNDPNNLQFAISTIYKYTKELTDDQFLQSNHFYITFNCQNYNEALDTICIMNNKILESGNKHITYFTNNLNGIIFYYCLVTTEYKLKKTSITNLNHLFKNVRFRTFTSKKKYNKALKNRIIDLAINYFTKNENDKKIDNALDETYHSIEFNNENEESNDKKLKKTNIEKIVQVKIIDLKKIENNCNITNKLKISDTNNIIFSDTNVIQNNNNKFIQYNFDSEKSNFNKDMDSIIFKLIPNINVSMIDYDFKYSIYPDKFIINIKNNENNTSQTINDHNSINELERRNYNYSIDMENIKDNICENIEFKESIKSDIYNRTNVNTIDINTNFENNIDLNNNKLENKDFNNNNNLNGAHISNFKDDSLNIIKSNKRIEDDSQKMSEYLKNILDMLEKNSEPYNNPLKFICSKHNITENIFDFNNDQKKIITNMLKNETCYKVNKDEIQSIYDHIIIKITNEFLSIVKNNLSNNSNIINEKNVNSKKSDMPNENNEVNDCLLYIYKSNEELNQNIDKNNNSNISDIFPDNLNNNSNSSEISCNNSSKKSKKPYLNVSNIKDTNECTDIINNSVNYKIDICNNNNSSVNLTLNEKNCKNDYNENNLAKTSRNFPKNDKTNDKIQSNNFKSKKNNRIKIDQEENFSNNKNYKDLKLEKNKLKEEAKESLSDSNNNESSTDAYSKGHTYLTRKYAKSFK